MPGFHHIQLKIASRSITSLLQSYNFMLAPLGITELMRFGGPTAGGGPLSVGMGDDAAKDCFLWITEAGAGNEGNKDVHIAFKAENRKQVDDFHKAAMMEGLKDNGEPGIRAKYGPNYYAAFVVDQAGNNLEAACTKAEGA